MGNTHFDCKIYNLNFHPKLNLSNVNKKQIINLLVIVIIIIVTVIFRCKPTPTFNYFHIFLANLYVADQFKWIWFNLESAFYKKNHLNGAVERLPVFSLQSSHLF